MVKEPILMSKGKAIEISYTIEKKEGFKQGKEILGHLVYNQTRALVFFF